MKQREVPANTNNFMLHDIADTVVGMNLITTLNDMSNNNQIDQPINNDVEFGGGQFGGAGAGGTWDDNNDNGSDTVSNDTSMDDSPGETFS
jgi:hypothetical protein